MASQNTLIYGKDETNTTRVLKCDDAGYLQIGTSANIGSTISIADYTTPANTLKIEPDGSINVNGGGGGGGGVIQALVNDVGVDLNGFIYDTSPAVGDLYALQVNLGAVDKNITTTPTKKSSLNCSITSSRNDLFTGVKNTDTTVPTIYNALDTYDRTVSTVRGVKYNSTVGEAPISANLIETEGEFGVVKSLSTVDAKNLYYGTSVPTTNTGALLTYNLNGGGGGGGALEATLADNTVVAVEAVAGTIPDKYSLATSDIKQTYTAQTNGASTRNFVNSYSKLVGNSTATVEHVALMDTAGRLQVNARISDTSGGGLASTSVGGIKALNVVDLNQTYTGTGSNASLNVNLSSGNVNGGQYTPSTGINGVSIPVSVAKNTGIGALNGFNSLITNVCGLDVDDDLPKMINSVVDGAGIQSLLVRVNNPVDAPLITSTVGNENSLGTGLNRSATITTVGGTTNKTYLDVKDVNNQNLYFGSSVPTTNTGALLTYNLNGGGGGGGVVQATLADNTVVAVEAVAGTAVDKYALTVSDVNQLYYTGTGTPSSTGALLTYNVNGGGGGGGALQATTSTGEVVAVEAILGGSTTETYVLATVDTKNKYFEIDPPLTNTGALLTYQVNSTSSTPLGAVNNIYSGTLTTGSSSTGLNINNTYGNESVLSYQDSSTSATGYVSIWGSLNNTTWFYLGVMAPTTVVRSTIRVSVAVLKLAGIKYIRITNEDTSTLTSITATLVSG